MKKLNICIVIILVSVFTLYSFSFNQVIDSTLEGTWVYSNYEDLQQVYKKRKGFNKRNPGFQLNADGTMLKRQNSGWCGTPPITYTNSKGTWELETESILRFEYDYWGGRDTMRMEIISHNSRELIVKRLND